MLRANCPTLTPMSSLTTTYGPTVGATCAYKFIPTANGASVSALPTMIKIIAAIGGRTASPVYSKVRSNGSIQPKSRAT